MSDWVRLKPGNDWGAVYYALEPTRPESRLWGKRRGIRLQIGEPIRFRWGAGQEALGTVTTRSEHREMSDHGSGYSFTDHVFCIEHDCFGTRVHIPLDAVDLPRDWVLARLPKEDG